MEIQKEIIDNTYLSMDVINIILKYNKNNKLYLHELLTITENVKYQLDNYNDNIFIIKYD